MVRCTSPCACKALGSSVAGDECMSNDASPCSNVVQVSKVLDKKEALLLQLRTMNDEAESGRHLDAASGRHTEEFQGNYARVILELKQVLPVLSWKPSLPTASVRILSDDFVLHLLGSQS